MNPSSQIKSKIKNILLRRKNNMDNTFSDMKSFSQEKTIELETEIEKTILYVAPLLFVFFSTNNANNPYGLSCIIFLIFAMLTSLINLVVLRNLFAELFNNAIEGESIENSLENKNDEQLRIDKLSKRAVRLGHIRNWFNGFFKLSIFFFVLSIISLILFLFNK